MYVCFIWYTVDIADPYHVNWTSILALLVRLYSNFPLAQKGLQNRYSGETPWREHSLTEVKSPTGTTLSTQCFLYIGDSLAAMKPLLGIFCSCHRFFVTSPTFLGITNNASEMFSWDFSYLSAVLISFCVFLADLGDFTLSSTWLITDNPNGYCDSSYFAWPSQAAIQSRLFPVT